MKNKNTRARPPRANTYAPYQGSELYALLDEALPQFRNRFGFLNLATLADAFSISKQAINGWFRRERIPPSRVDELIELSRDENGIASLSIKKLRPFIFK